jgi:CubicO group peptidase (beta-lactamase class C family)
MTGLARDFNVVGGQLALFHDGVTATWEFGDAEFGTGRPVGERSAFAFGSVTKVLTAALVMRLVADGDLYLDRPVRSWLSAHDPAGTDPALEVTLSQLLSHTAGLASDHDSDARSLGEWLDGFLISRSGCGTAWCPDRGAFSYSNVGYAIAGRVIEAVTDLSWAEAVHYCLLEPLGIAAGTLPGAIGGSEQVARVYGHVMRETDDGSRVFRPVPCITDPGSSPAGGLAGTAAGLVTLARLFLDDDQRIMPELDVLKQMTRPVAGAEPFGLADGWGLGLACYGTPGRGAWYGHDGAIDGTTCHMRVQPQQGTAVALVTNSATGQGLWDAVVGELNAAGIPVRVHVPDPPMTAAVASFTECAGTYRNGDLSVTVEVDEAGLGLRLPNGVIDMVEPHAGMVFSAQPGGATVFLGRFVKNAVSGAVWALQYCGRTLLRENAMVTSHSMSRGVST